MKKSIYKSAVLAIIAIAIFSIISCNNEKLTNFGNSSAPIDKTEIPSIDTEQSVLFSADMRSGTVQVLDYDVDEIENEIVFKLRILNNNQYKDRILRIEVNGTAGISCGYDVVFEDMNNNLLWQFIYKNSLQEQNHFWITEKTATDEMTIEQLANSKSVMETYTLNGTTKEYTFNSGNINRIELLRDELAEEGRISKLNPNTYSVSDMEILRVIDDFNVNHDTRNSLYNNVEGMLVADIITNDEFADFITNMVMVEGSEDTIELESIWAYICDAAVHTAILKCPVGGASNAVCDVALGVAAVCAVAQLF
jgi:hypothetical protein